MARSVDNDELSEPPHCGGVGLVAVEVEIDGSVLDVVGVALGNPVPRLTSFIPVAVLLAFHSG